MKTYDNFYHVLCSYNNLHLAYTRARKGKTLKPYVIAFEENLKKNLLQLHSELLWHTYRPKPLTTFILRDPKTRTISKSDFRDRIVHHALCNMIEPIYEKRFIYDSYANRIGKGTRAAIARFKQFERKVSRNYSTLPDSKHCKGFALKADIRKYFDTVNHTILLSILRRRIRDERVMWLIKLILENHHTEKDRGMPLGNLTSQFFANVYLNELDQFVKHELKAQYYIRYVDDFVILHNSPQQLQEYKIAIRDYLRDELDLQLHPDKSKIIPLHQGISFLGLRIFPHHVLLQQRNVRKFRKKLKMLLLQHNAGELEYDVVYDFLEGWSNYVKQANTYRLREGVIDSIRDVTNAELSTKEYNRAMKDIAQQNNCLPILK